MKIHPKEVKARVLLHRRIGPDYFRLRLLCPEVARPAHPGQFAMLRVSEWRDPFLRRPFGFCRIFSPKGRRVRPEDEGAVEIWYKVVGRGTALMSQIREGQRVDLLGPLGKGFWAAEGKKQAILVGGGIGIAPLMAWAEELQLGRRKMKRPPKISEEAQEVLILIGGKNAEEILGVREFKQMGFEPQVATEDGRLGMQGLATDLLERELLTQGPAAAAIYACGPIPMLTRVAQIAEQFDVPCQVLVESRMACGIGACLGCAVKVREEGVPKMSGAGDFLAGREGAPPECGGEEGGGGASREGLIPLIAEPPPFRYVRACKEGPVFDAREILWE